MSQFEENVRDRARIIGSEIAQGLLLGDPEASLNTMKRVITDPDSLQPEEMETAARHFGVTDRLTSFFVDVATDPLIWAGAWLSRKFPISKYLRNEIPKRYIGNAKEFVGLSKLITPITSRFRGTFIPGLEALYIKRRQSYLENIGGRLRELQQHPEWKSQKHNISLMLEGQPVSNITPAAVELKNKVRAVLDEVWHLTPKEGRITGTLDTGFGFQPYRDDEAPRYLRDWLLHIPMFGTKDELLVRSANEGIERLLTDELRQGLELKGVRLPWLPTKGTDVARSDWAQFQRFISDVGTQVWNPQMFPRILHTTPAGEKFTLGVHGEGYYVTDLDMILGEILRSGSRSYALNTRLSQSERALLHMKIPETGEIVTPSGDPLIMQVANEGIRAITTFEAPRAMILPEVFRKPGSNILAGIQRDEAGNILPLKHVSREMKRSLQQLMDNFRGNHNEAEMYLAETLHATLRPIMKMAKLGKVEDMETASIFDMQRRRDSFRNLNNRLVTLMYGGLLGLNAKSTLNNSMQSFMTTIPSLGIGSYAAGLATFAKKVPEYLKRLGVEAFANGRRPWKDLHEASEAALRATFPELIGIGIKTDPRLFDIDVTAAGLRVGGRLDRALTQHFDPVLEKVTRAVMSPFTAIEFSNKASAYYAAQHALKKGIRLGEEVFPDQILGHAAKMDEWINFRAAQIVNDTQFIPGPGTRTTWQNSLPPIARQFSTYWTRYLSWMYESTLKGAMTQEQLNRHAVLRTLTGGRNLGPIARTMVMSEVARLGFRDVLGVDMASGLEMLPINFTPGDMPLAPLPLPPIAGVGWGLVNSFATGDIEEMDPLVLPKSWTGGVGAIPVPKALVPGGLAVSRVVRALDQWQPDIGGPLDRNNRLIRIGNQTDQFLAMMGIPAAGATRERKLTSQLLHMRDRQRELRREYLAAVSTYDTGRMMSLQKKWLDTFPDMPPITVTRRDLANFQTGARIPRLQRVLKTMSDQEPFLEKQILDMDTGMLNPAQLSYMQDVY